MEQRHTPAAGTAEPEVFDYARALEGVGGDDELLSELVDLFLEDCPRMVDAIGAAVDVSDADALQRAAHTLKGSVSVFAASAVSEMALQLEQIGLAGDFDVAAEAFARLQEEVERLRPHLEALRA